MTQSPETELLRRAYATIEKMQARIKAFENKKAEPVAIIGMACRFPGCAYGGLSTFWTNLCDGHDAITEVPRERWDIDQYYDPNPSTPGKMSTRWGGFIEKADLFDAAFFGITPREARSMDPQQRLLLEVAWEALEDAGRASLVSLNGSATGTFVGISTDDYAQLQMDQNGAAGIDTYFASGTARSIASGRLAYLFGLKGPALSIDTACSSSLVAVHQAYSSLLNGECNMALAAGVNLMLSPVNTITLSKYQMMAPDGRSKTFDAEADGFVRGEGCGVVVLKRLKDAVADRDHIHAVIRGSAVNQDGPSSGLTVPNGPSQKAVIKEALRRAGITPGQVKYVETHGTGTALGDPIEVRSLGECFGADHTKEDPLIIGSVKPNIGHLESASGIAGLIKAVLILKKGLIPRNIHLNTPNPNIPWARYPIAVPTRTLPFPAKPGHRYVGVTGLGFSGTNVHLILSDMVEKDSTKAVPPPPLHLIPLSADSPETIRDKAGNLVEWLDKNPEASLGDIALTLGAGHPHRSQRHAIIADSRRALQSSMAAFSRDKKTSPRSIDALETGETPKIAFLITGQGCQYPGMGLELYRNHPKFRQTIDQCDDLLGPILGCSIRKIIFSEQSDETNPIHKTQYTQPALFVLEYALARLWQSWGIHPSFLLGHSLGEYVAACIADIFSLEDALKIVTNRARLMQSLDTGGAMHAILAPEQLVVEAVEAHTGIVSIAAYNGPENVVISGKSSDVNAVSSQFHDKGYMVSELKVSHAFHSPLMSQMLNPFEASLEEVIFKPPQIRLISNLSGDVADFEEITTPRYWRNHIENAVRFRQGVETISQKECRLFLEIGPHPVLSGMARQCIPGPDHQWLPSLHRQYGDWQSIFGTLSEFYLQGIDIHWERLYEPFRFKRLSLPPTPLHRKRFWFTETVSNQTAPVGVHKYAGVHPLAVTESESATGHIVFRAVLDDDRTAFFREHRVADMASLPVAAVLEAAFHIATQLMPDEPSVHIRDLSMDHMIEIPENTVVTIEWNIDRNEDGSFQFSLHSRFEGESVWQRNATGIMSSGQQLNIKSPFTPEDLKRTCKDTVSADHFYALFNRSGLLFGPSFQPLKQLWTGEQMALGRLSADTSEGLKTSGFGFSPLLIDGALQVIAGTYADLANTTEQITLYLPIGIDRFEIFAIPSGDIWGYATIRPISFPDQKSMTGDIQLIDDAGKLIAAINGCRLLSVDRDALTSTHNSTEQNPLYTIHWQTDDEATADKTEATVKLLRIAEPLNLLVPEIARKHNLDDYERHFPELDNLVSLYIRAALKKLGWQPAVGEHVTSAQIAGQLHVQDRYNELFSHFLKMLAQDGFLAPTGEGWKVEHDLGDTDAIAAGQKIKESQPATAVEVELVNRCGRHLAEVLRGEEDPLELLFGSDAFSYTMALYHDTTTACIYNDLITECIKRLEFGNTGHSPLRVLEIGAGTGGVTQAVMNGLEERSYIYLSTDISSGFVNAAKRRFEHLDNFNATVLDIEKAPGQQGFDDTGFDLIIAANVVHATADLAQTLQHIHQLTAPGGAVLLLEVTKPLRWIDITFGLTDGWWKFTDRAVRRNYPLIDTQSWQHLLRDAGFKDCIGIPDIAELPAGSILTAESIIAAQRPIEPGEEEHYFILSEENALSRELSESLNSQGFSTTMIPKKVLGEEDHHNALRKHLLGAQIDIPAGQNFRQTVILYVADSQSSASRQVTDSLTLQQHHLSPVLHMFQILAAEKELPPPRVTVVTRAAQADTDDRTLNPHAATLWGMIRSVMLEHPEFKCKLIDLPAEPEQTDAACVFRELLYRDSENQVLIRQGRRRLARLTPQVLETEPRHNSAIQRLDTSGRGLLDNLHWLTIPPQTLGTDQVRIQVYAGGLNFRDVLNALGEYADGPVPFGGECAGIVVETGKKVTDLRPGDRVMAIAPHSLSSEVVVHSGLTRKVPDTIDLANGAAQPIAYITAWYALDELAHLQSGQSILIHAAAGGVGMAAVHIAMLKGAVVYATAGSPEKHAYLKNLGIEHIMSSRSLDFADQIKELTQDKGVDVVLNSLSGDFIKYSLSCLGTGGTYLELGRTDIPSPETVGKKRPDVAYHPINLTDAMTSASDTIQRIFREVGDRIADGVLPLLPCKVFPHTDVIDAFRFMAGAKHIGKIVLAWPPQENEIKREVRIHSSGTYWITGGFGGLGLLTAQWLAKKGAGHILLTGRHEPTAEVAAMATSLQQSGTRVTIMKNDVASRDQVDSLLAGIASSEQPLRGIIHAAGVLDDGVLGQQNWERFETVFKAKVAGAWNLHEASRNLDLDFFVLYSSAASLLGASGQVNHCAANAFMDGLATARRLSGLKATSINWGAWADVGAAVKAEAAARAVLKGVDHINPATAISYLEKLICSELPQCAVMSVNWQQYVHQVHPDGIVPSLIASLVQSPYKERVQTIVSETAPLEHKNLPQLLAECPETRRKDLLIDYLHTQTLHILGLDTTEIIDPDKALMDLGLDSLMAVEMRNAISSAVGRNLPASLLFDYPTLQSVSDFLLDALGMTVPEGNTADDVEEHPESTDDLLRRIETMPDEEVDRLMNAKDPNS